MNALRRTLPLLLLGVLLAAATRPAAASEHAKNADEENLETYCETSVEPCRKNVRIVLRRKEGEAYDETFALLPPAVQPGMLSIHPGETVRAVPEFENGEFAGWRTPKADEPADTQILTISLEQSENNPGMMASVGTNTGPALKLRMGLVRIDGDDSAESTSSCPLEEGGGHTFEMWPYPVFVLLVADATRPAKDDGAVCK